MINARTIAACLASILATSAIARADVEATDDLGNVITLPRPASRIVSLAPHITELVFAAGAGAELVGVVRHSDYPPAAQRIPRVGESNAISYETLVSMRPDLVVTWNSGNGPQISARLQELGLTVYENEPRTLLDIARSLRNLGHLSGHDEDGEAAADAFTAEYEQLVARYEGQRVVTVFYQVWDRPMITLNGKHLISDVMRLCGGVNVFADAIPIAPQISIEAVIRANPQVIIASGMAEARPEWLAAWKTWRSIDAVRQGQLYFVPPDLLQRHTPRVLEGARMLCGRLEQARALVTRGRSADRQ